jgi:hypothetical protein
MTVRKLDRIEWRSFCDRVSKGLHGQRAEIQVPSRSLNSQATAAWSLLTLRDPLMPPRLEEANRSFEEPRRGGEAPPATRIPG